MVHEGEVGNLDLTIVDREHFCVHELIVTHIVNLDATLMVSLEVLDHVLLAVTKQFEESATWKPHRDDPICYVAQVEVEA